MAVEVPEDHPSRRWSESTFRTQPLGGFILSRKFQRSSRALLQSLRNARGNGNVESPERTQVPSFARTRRFRSLGLALLGAALTLASAGASRANIDSIEIGANMFAPQRWEFIVTVHGSNFENFSGSLTYPGGAPVELLPGDDLQLQFVATNNFQSYATLADLVAENPAGTYRITLTDEAGAKTIDVDWAPVFLTNGSGGEPFLTIDSPAILETINCGAPIFKFSSDCATCPDATLSLPVFGPEFVGGTAPPFGPILYTTLRDENDMPPPLPMPNGTFHSAISVGSIVEAPNSQVTTGSADSFLLTRQTTLRRTRDFNSFLTPPGIEEIELTLGEDGSGRFDFNIEATGSNLCTASVMIPGNPIAQEFAFDEAEGDFIYSDGPFANFDDAIAANPAGVYTFLINAQWAGAVSVGPTELVGSSVSITSPANGAANISPTPNIGIDIDCASCNAGISEIGDTATNNGLVSCETDLLTPPFPTTLLFSDFIENEDEEPPLLCTSLPDAKYQVELIAGILSERMELVTDGSSPVAYLFREASLLSETQTFTVPEPEPALQVLLAIVTLAGLRAARRERTL